MTTTSDPGTAGWRPDPYGRYDFRYFNGQRWTSDVAVDGVRYVDQSPTAYSGVGHGSPVAPPPSGAPAIAVVRHPGGATPPAPGNGKAILSFLFGLGSVLLGWTPFFFVIGAGAAIAAIVLGILVLRRRPTVSKTRGFAIAGLVLAPIGLALCVVGVILTGLTVRELEAYSEPGPFDVDVTECSQDGGTATMSGTLTNADDETRSYLVRVEFVDDGSRVGTDRVELDDLAAGETTTWSTHQFVGSTEIECRIRGVNGPYPFGIETDG